MTPFAEARIHCLAPAVTYAANIFEGIRAYWNEDEQQLYVFRLEEHLERLEYSARVMRFGAHPYGRDVLRGHVLSLLRANNARESVHLRIHLYIDEDGMMTATGPVGMFVSCVFRPTSPMAKTGCKAQVSSWTRLRDSSSPPRVKTTANYVNGRLASIQAKQDGYDTAIILNDAGDVSEGPAACIFIVRDGVLVTPDVTRNILESVTRDTLIQRAQEWCGTHVVERAIGRTELYACEEAFFCGTGQEITPIVSIDGLAIGTGAVGPLTAKLQERYFAVTSGRDTADAQWRLPVYA